MNDLSAKLLRRNVIFLTKKCDLYHISLSYITTIFSPSQFSSAAGALHKAALAALDGSCRSLLLPHVLHLAGNSSDFTRGSTPDAYRG